jgi:hypothetical protein
VDDLLDRIQILERTVVDVQHQAAAIARRLRWWRRFAFSLALLTMFSVPLTLGAAQDERRGGKPNDDHQATLKGLLQRFLAVERKLQHVTSEIGPEGFPELVITGANLRIVNGLDRTDLPNGTGNLIVGYNEARAAQAVSLVGPDDRTGSHNLVVGSGLNFESVGGLVVGRNNTIGFFSVGLGNFNTAEAPFSAVTGGQLNLASGPFSVVSGGESNEASGFGASVSGGNTNKADGSYAVVSGGGSNTASGTVSVVSGGRQNTAGAVASSVSGGSERRAEGDADWVAGGLFQDQ